MVRVKIVNPVTDVGFKTQTAPEVNLDPPLFLSDFIEKKKEVHSICSPLTNLKFVRLNVLVFHILKLSCY